ncbi:SDR family oxidoreductase [Kitasatospora phosalacinea]|uniref:SDR family oxidoreductase n=1 Tax=Kitasatospora phosalacinea TaxID=2065 RepID=UPI0025555274|nr:SDR family oxidoreductase [Kitasatospora phosalacinea]
MAGRVAVVTGAARGLGAALAAELSQRGATVALLGLNGRALERVSRSLPGPSGCWEADVTDDGAMDRAAAGVREELGTPSVLVANAGVAEGGPFADSDPATWRRVVEVNLTGSATSARAFLPDLLATRGYLLQIASLAAMGTSPMMSAYCASKAGVEAFAHALQAELAHRHVGVGIAYLNWIDTDMVRDADRHTVLRELRTHMPRPARKVYPPRTVAARLVRAVERRSPAVYVPGWLRAVQPVRAALPPLVTRLSRTEVPRIAAHHPFRPTGLLGAGGRDAVTRDGPERAR